MTTFVMATQISPETLLMPDALGNFEKRVMAYVRSECPDVRWLHSWAVLGPFDYVDIRGRP